MENVRAFELTSVSIVFFIFIYLYFFELELLIYNILYTYVNLCCIYVMINIRIFVKLYISFTVPLITNKNKKGGR